MSYTWISQKHSTKYRIIYCWPNFGVTVSFDLQWTRHIEQTTAKANRTLGLVKRVCRDVGDIRTRRLLYCTLVRPQLEYCSSLWSPYTTKHRALVENVQRRATKFILNYPPSNVSYIDRLTILDLLPLEHRRSIKDIILFHKFKSGIMPIECNQFFNPTNSIRTTRNSNPSNFKVNVQHKQNYFRFSFFPRTVNLWNSVSKDIKDSSSVKLLKPDWDSTSKACYQATYYRNGQTFNLLLYFIFSTCTCMCLYLCKGTVVNWDISPVTVSRHYVVIVTNTIN